MAADNYGKIYYIPDNFADEPKIFQGMVSIRKLAEGIVMGLIGIIISMALPFNMEVRFSIAFVLAIPLIGLGVMGIKGTPVSEFLKNVYEWATNRRIMLYNTHTSSYDMPIADMMLTAERPVDAIDDWLTSFKRKHSRNRNESDMLIEGRDFEFADSFEQVYANTKRTPNYYDRGTTNKKNSMIDFED